MESVRSVDRDEEGSDWDGDEKAGDRGGNGAAGDWPRLRWIGRQSCRTAALVVWAGICGYAWFRGALATPYTVAAVGGVVGVALVAGGVDDRAWLPAARSGADRWLLAGCLLGIAAGTVGVGLTAGGAGRPDPVAGGVLVAALVVLAGRLISWRLAAAAALVLGAAAVADPTPEFVAALLDGPVGVYGAPTRAITWLGPVCLLAGLWEAAGIGGWLHGWPIDAGPADTEASAATAASRRLVGVAGLVGVLIAWRTAGTARTAGGLLQESAVLVPAALVPAVLVPMALLPTAMGIRSRPAVLVGAVDTTDVGRSTGQLVVAAGPVALMGWLLAGPRPPVGTVLAAGCLAAVGLCLLAALIRAVTGEKSGASTGQSANPIGGRTVADGAVGGVGLLARVVVVLAVVGAAVAAAETVGLSARLLSGVLWLGGGPMGGLAVLGGLCLLAGAGLPTLAGYVAAALVAVPAVRTLAAVDPLAAHLGVWYAVAAGALLAVVWRRSEYGGVAATGRLRRGR